MTYEIIETREFAAQADKARLRMEDIRKIENGIMSAPTACPVIPGTNGLRKMRFAPRAQRGGKSGGLRICYFVVDSALHLWLVTVFAKNQRADLTQAERNAIAGLVARIKDRYKR